MKLDYFLVERFSSKRARRKISTRWRKKKKKKWNYETFVTSIKVSHDQSCLGINLLLFLKTIQSFVPSRSSLSFLFFFLSSDPLFFRDDDNDDDDRHCDSVLRRANIYHRVFEFGTESQRRRSIVGDISKAFSKDDAWSGQSGRESRRRNPRMESFDLKRICAQYILHGATS